MQSEPQGPTHFRPSGRSGHSVRLVFCLFVCFPAVACCSTSLLSRVKLNKNARGIKHGVEDIHTHIHFNTFAHVYQHKRNRTLRKKKKMNKSMADILCMDRGNFSNSVQQHRFLEGKKKWSNTDILLFYIISY